MVRSTEKPPSKEVSEQSLPETETVLAEAGLLICEPDAALRCNIAELMHSTGFATVAAATDIEDAADLCGACPPEVILYRVTDEDSIDQSFTDELRKLNPTRAVSVIYLHTGDVRKNRRILLTHADDCLSLDDDLEELPRRVLVHARLRLVERMLLSERSAMEKIVDKRTERLNQALDLLRAAEKRLRGELTEAKSEARARIDYFAETQHELRTPLNAICGMSDAIRTKMFGPLENPKYAEYAENIFQSGQHLLSIIDGRLELSRIEAGVDPLETDALDVGSVIEETTEMLGRLAEKANVSLDVEVEPDLPAIKSDRRKLRQVLVNLVSNAIKFTPEKGRVVLSAKRNDTKGVLILIVSDTGIGMSPDDTREAVKPYRRMSGDRRSGERGMGLGLSIVRKLVEMLGATIEIQSTPGKGTSVKVEIPIAISNVEPLSAVG